LAELREIADGVVAYLQPDGSWGLSNAGLIVGECESLLVDTLFDLAHTRRMLDAYRDYGRGLDQASVVVNTHANGDHCYGNQLFAGKRIVASNRAAREMREMLPSKLASLMKAATLARRLGSFRPKIGRLFKSMGLSVASDLLDAAPYVSAAFERFDYRDIELEFPNETFDGQLEIDLGGKHVLLLEVGPAHTAGDVVVYVPETKTLFSGDLLFEGMHPLVWGGTIAEYLGALERLLGLGPEVVIPGHGEVTDSASIVRHMTYLRALRDEAEPLYQSGASAEQAAATLMRQGFGQLREPERLVVNVTAAYREFAGLPAKNEVISLFGAMARLAGRS
jgi:glyoxylase-like metal-dependent hydrolase (beta-lactamase superfamily II)